MAEKIVSPGVFTRENDLSFLAQGVANIGAAFIGPFKEGPVVPTVVESQAEFETLFGVPDGTYYTPIAVQNYLREAGIATICRVAGLGGYTEQNPLLLTVASGSMTASVGILFSTANGNAISGLSGSVVADTGYGDFTISSSAALFSGSTSVDSEDANDIESLFGTNPLGTKGAYVYGLFKEHSVLFTSESVVSATLLGDQDFTFDAQEALTPTIQSQLISGERHDLFKFYTLGVGNAANTKVKIAITNIKPAGSIAGSDYGTFSVFVRQFSDTNKKRTILEQFNNVTLDPNSPNYIARVIGDRSRVINTEGKISEYGDWANQSRYIRLWNSNDTGYKNANEIPVQAVPFAHAAYQLPISASTEVSALIPTASFVTASATQFGGLDLDGNDDNLIYLKPIPEGATVGANGAYSLDTIDGVSLTTSTDLSKRNFIVCFQEGFDGMSPATVINLGSDITSGNSQGFDLSSSTAKGSLAYAKAVAALSNADEFDINMVATPGVIRRHHPAIVTSVIELCENRADCFYIMDSTSWSDTPAQAITQASAIDSNYVATYYPWVKTVDINTNKLIQVPPSVLLPGVFAASDNVSAEWFAPAGLNRGGLLGAVSVQNRLTQAEKDDLYEGKVNPIVQFPGQGIVVFGQKTLQDRPSALDRINVRRLLLTVRKFIASSSRYLVFEQNSADTRQRFLQIVNPYLESIQQRQGLYAFKVVMDESNNTPDVIDRNILKGDIYLQPTKTAEFIVLDFNILPTGATFEG
jgi:hypothetical protein